MLRLDKVLHQQNSLLSRSFVAKQIVGGYVTVNGRVVDKPSYLVREDDQITFDYPKESSYHLEPFSSDIEIIFEANDFLVINKPAGLLTHPAASAKDAPDLSTILSKKIDQALLNNSGVRPGIVHRLDKNTTGLLLMAKTPEGFNALSELFMSRAITKKYFAIVCGVPAWDEKVCNSPIGRSPKDPTKMQIMGINPKPAVSILKVIKRFENYSLLDVEIQTGRTHQIRVHLASLGYPVLGDLVYGKSSPVISRQALHAYSLSFPFRQELMNFEIPLPLDMQAVLSSGF